MSDTNQTSIRGKVSTGLKRDFCYEVTEALQITYDILTDQKQEGDVMGITYNDLVVYLDSAKPKVEKDEISLEEFTKELTKKQSAFLDAFREQASRIRHYGEITGSDYYKAHSAEFFDEKTIWPDDPYILYQFHGVDGVLPFRSAGIRYFSKDGFYNDTERNFDPVFNWQGEDRHFPRCKKAIDLIQQRIRQNRTRDYRPPIGLFLAGLLLIILPIIAALLQAHGIYDVNGFLDNFDIPVPKVNSALLHLAMFALVGFMKLALWVIVLVPVLLYKLLELLMRIHVMKWILTVLLGLIVVVYLLVFFHVLWSGITKKEERRYQSTKRKLRKLMASKAFQKEKRRLMESEIYPLCWAFPFFLALYGDKNP